MKADKGTLIQYLKEWMRQTREDFETNERRALRRATESVVNDYAKFKRKALSTPRNKTRV